MITEEIRNRVATFIEMEERSGTPVRMTAENIARLCYITVEEAEGALRELEKCQRTSSEETMEENNNNNQSNKFHLIAVKVNDEGTVGQRKLIAGKPYYFLDGFQ